MNSNEKVKITKREGYNKRESYVILKYDKISRMCTYCKNNTISKRYSLNISKSISMKINTHIFLSSARFRSTINIINKSYNALL